MSVPADAKPSLDRVLYDRLNKLHPKKIDLSLGRMHRLLDRLGNPEKKLPPVIHVAGTNGKGSVVATTRAIAEAAGLRVHTYTSPHLVRFNERIRIAGKLITNDRLAELLDECEDANRGEPITFFEMTTALALLAFSRIPADLCLLEVGLGGRLDATNVVTDPLATAITPVSFDHMEFLGETLPAIAGEKAGIIKSRVPVIVGQQDKDVLWVIRERAREVGAPLFALDQDWKVSRALLKDREALIYSDATAKLDLPVPALPGDHQIYNAGMALAILRHQRQLTIPSAAFRAGLDWVRWPARLQRLEQGALVKDLPAGASLWVDGGHNPSAGQVMRGFFRQLDADTEELHVICAMLSNKDQVGFLKAFPGLARSVYAIPLPESDNGLPPAQLAEMATSVGLAARMAPSISSALGMITASAGQGRKISVLITGSLYLAGEALRQNGTPPT